VEKVWVKSEPILHPRKGVLKMFEKRFKIIPRVQRSAFRFVVFFIILTQPRKTMRDTALILHFIGLAMGLGTSFANLFLGLAMAKMPPDEAKSFGIKAMALTKMGHIGITLLILSGLYLMSPYWRILPEMPLLIAKLSLVVLLVILISVITSAGIKFRNGDASQIKKIKALGRVTLITALLIVILAVTVFH
jgi:hypothetical protein